MSSFPEKMCNCPKSKCLKLYCSCFVAQQYCSALCGCTQCHNIEDNIVSVQRHHRLAERRKTQRRLKGGCACTRSRCLTKYCECMKIGVACGKMCGCRLCLNFANPFAHNTTTEAETKTETEAETEAETDAEVKVVDLELCDILGEMSCVSPHGILDGPTPVEILESFDFDDLDFDVESAPEQEDKVQVMSYIMGSGLGLWADVGSNGLSFGKGKRPRE